MAPAFADLYVAGSRIVMRCIITLFAEARNLLPVDNPIYTSAPTAWKAFGRAWTGGPAVGATSAWRRAAVPGRG